MRLSARSAAAILLYAEGTAAAAPLAADTQQTAPSGVTFNASKQ